MQTSDIAFAKALRRLTVLVFLAASSLATTACSFGGSDGGSGTPARPMAAYCPYLPSRTFSPAITVSGKAYYQYRHMGNGDVSDSQHTYDVTGTATGETYSLTINGTVVSWNCGGVCSASAVATALAGAINSASVPTSATSSGSLLVVKPKQVGDPITISGESTKLSRSTVTEPRINPRPNPRPIRYAEIRISDSAGNIVQCGETDGTGSFNLQLPSNSGTYSFVVASRSNNSKNTAYVLNNPTDNDFHKLTASVSTSTNSDIRLVAPATNTLEGGAFNILDQILNAQEYLRTKTADCNNNGATNYFPGCSPFTTAPLVYAYWSKGVSPGVYVGQAGGISFYLNTKRELYILGGVNGDTENTDMDHFDNSVIVHEYGHFIEDQFGKPNSPGGSHDGKRPIDPRLAWGEGWANFFQAAVLGNSYYRDTYGRIDCTGQAPCTGTAFNVDLSDDGEIDVPQFTGEGNFREFSISRLLWDVIGSLKFAEIWSTFSTSTNSMRNSSDEFKTITRFHTTQRALNGSDTWSSFRTTEKQRLDFTDYGRTFTSNNSCASWNVSMNIVKIERDNGDPGTANHFSNNDYYLYSHPGGTFNLNLSWSGSDPVDLDLYVYQSGYVHRTAGIAGRSEASTNITSGTETISGSLPGGIYMINVSAYMGIYPTLGTHNYSTSYNMTLNGVKVCPTPP